MIDLKTLSIRDEYLVPVSKKEHGVFSYIVHNPDLTQELKRLYCRDGLCLKVFKKPATTLDEFKWGKENLLVDCTKIQNLFAMEGIAPRVYDIVQVSNRFAQVTDYVVGDGEWEPQKATELQYRYHLNTRWDMNKRNHIGKMWVDFQPWSFNDPKGYQQSLIDRAYKVAAWGSRSEPYQSIFKSDSQRNMSSRADAMHFDEIDWRGKTALDIGCNLGMICREVTRRGVKYAVGVDLPHVADLCREVANWYGDWNVDFLGLKLPAQKEQIQGRFDVVFALSVDRQVGYGKWMADLCNEVFILEGHVPDQEETYRDKLERDFRKVEFLGMSRDHGPRPLFRCWK